MTMSEPNHTVPVRGLGAVSAFSVVVGSVLATGIFIQPWVVVCHVSTPLMSMGVC